MGRISRENIEEFILDYLEGNLDKNTHAEVNEFLLHNPDIEKEIFDLDITYLEPKEIKYPEKASLKAKESISEFEDKCILAIENQLESKDITSFEKEVASNKTKMELMGYYKKTILSPDNSIVFTAKNSLKHNISFKFRRIMYYSSAAAIILLISVSSLLMKKSNISERNIVDYYIPLASDLKKETVIEVPKQEPARNIIITPKQESKSIKSQTIIVNEENISKMPEVSIIPGEKTLLANSVFNSPEPSDIIISENKYALASHRDFCLNENAMKWSEGNKRRQRRSNQGLNTILNIGESKIRTFVSRFVNTTRISHERIVYVADSKMD